MSVVSILKPIIWPHCAELRDKIAQILRKMTTPRTDGNGHNFYHKLAASWLHALFPIVIINRRLAPSLSGIVQLPYCISKCTYIHANTECTTTMTVSCLKYLGPSNTYALAWEAVFWLGGF